MGSPALKAEPKAPAHSGPNGRENDAKAMPFLDHLEELRWRILKSLVAVIICAIGIFAYSDIVLMWLVAPARSLPHAPGIIFLSPVGMFLTHVNIALVGGLIVAFPIVGYQAWSFIAPGLFTRERRLLVLAMLATVGCFAAGAVMAYAVVLPLALRFLVGLGTADVTPQWDIGRYIGFVLRLVVAFGLVFELPVLSYVLARLGIVNAGLLRRGRRYALVGMVVLAALLTPPDVISQLLMAGPLFLLYEVSIWVARIAGRPRETTP